MVSSFAVFEARREKGLGIENGVWVLADPDGFEEGICKEAVSVLWTGSKAVKILKSGGTVVGAAEMREIAGLAEKRWRVVVAAIQKASNGV